MWILGVLELGGATRQEMGLDVGPQYTLESNIKCFVSDPFPTTRRLLQEQDIFDLSLNLP